MNTDGFSFINNFSNLYNIKGKGRTKEEDPREFVETKTKKKCCNSKLILQQFYKDFTRHEPNELFPKLL